MTLKASGRQPWWNISATVLNYLVVLVLSAAAAPPLFDPLGQEREINAVFFVPETNSIQFTVVAQDPNGDAVTLAATNVPFWATFNPTTGVFNGTTPAWSTNKSTRQSQQGIFDVTFTASDGAYAVQKIVTICVLDSSWSQQTMTELVANRRVTSASVQTSVVYQTLSDTNIWSSYGGGKMIRQITCTFTSQVPSIAGFEKDWSTTNYIFLPTNSPSATNAGVVVEGYYSGAWGYTNFAERVCAELNLPVIFADVGWEYRFPDPSFYFDKAVEYRDPAYIWWPFVAGHFMRNADALVTVINDKTAWLASYSNFQYIVTGHSKFGCGVWATAAADPQRVAGLMSAGFEPQDYDAYRLLARFQGASSTYPDAWTNYIGTMMRFYVNPLDNVEEMNSDARCLISGGTQDSRGSDVGGGYQPKYLTLVSTGQLTVPFRIGHVPNLIHTTISSRHATYWLMLLAHRFLNRPLSDINGVRHFAGSTGIVVEATVSGLPTVSNVTIWATSQSDINTNDWNGFAGYAMTPTGGVYRGEIPSNSVAYYVEVMDIANGVNGAISSAPQPVNRDYPLLHIPPWDISGFAAQPDPQIGGINLVWTNPPVSDLAGVIIRCSTNSYPTNALDKTLVYDGAGSAFAHTGTTAGATYYYAAFTYDAVGDYGAAVQVTAVAPERDSDLDGMPDWWEQAYFNSPTNAAATSDDDGDRAINLFEYIAGTVPTNGASVFRITQCVVDDASGFHVLKWTSVSNRFYALKWCTNLSISFSLLTNQVDTTPPENVYTATQQSAENNVFYRVSTTQP